MANNRKTFGASWVATPLFYHTSGVGYVVSNWFFGINADTQPAFLKGRENIVTSSKHAYLQGRNESTPKRWILGDQDRYATEIFYKTSGVATPATNWFFSQTPSYTHAYLNGVSLSAMIAQLFFSIPTANEKHSTIHAFLLTQSNASSVLPAYMNSGAGVYTSSASAYIFCEMTGTTSSSAYLNAYDTSSVTTPAYLSGSAHPKATQAAYLKGQADSTGSQKAFLRGMSNTTSSTPAYIPSAISAKDAVSAFTRNGTDVTTSHQAYIWCDSSRSSVHAYLEAVSTNPVSVKSAFLMGGGTFPFTDDFTGTDSNPWNPLKWNTEENG